MNLKEKLILIKENGYVHPRYIPVDARNDK